MKLLTVAELRDLESQVAKEEISYSRMVEVINEKLVEQPKIETVTTTKPKCYHKNGWFKAVVFKWWIFDIRRKFFLCTDCQDLIPLEEVDEIQKHFNS